MNSDLDIQFTNELRQQEVGAGLHHFDLERRDFLKLFSGGVLICLCSTRSPAQESGRTRSAHELPKDIAAWLRILDDGHVTVFTGKVEVGQNIRTSLAQKVSEELRTSVESISLIMGDTKQVPWDAGTFGSRTTPTMGPQLRTMAVAARDLLVNMAASAWKVDASTLVAADGRVRDPKSGKSISYGELARGQKMVKVIEGDPSFTPASQWKVAGQPIPKVDGPDFVTGKHEYASDIHLPGMLHGKVLRPSGFNATLTSLDDSAAKKMAAVTVVRDANFVGVTAPSTWSAEKAIQALKAEWKVPPQISSRELFAYLTANADKSKAEVADATGSISEGMAKADVKVSQTYTVAYIQHAPLEPRAAVAEWQGEKLTVWTGTQRPFGVRDELAAAFHIPTKQVRVIVPDTGSGYGGKHTGECAVEAARLARGCGKPVKLVWTREEEFTWAYFRPAGVIDIKSGIAADGTLVAWEMHNYNSGPSAIETPYNVANKKTEFHPTQNPPLRQGSYRGLAATANHFAREVHMDELAALANLDPLQFRLKNLTDARLRAAFETVAQRFGWGKQAAGPTRGFGIAGGYEKGGYLATCAEVAIDRARGECKIVRVVQTFDCGAVVNPNGLCNQISGAIIQGIGGAMFEAIHFQNGRVSNPRFHDYRVPRFSDTPQVEVELIDRKDQPSMGAGETPLMGLAPAVANAIASATGIRLRSLPLMAKPLTALS